MKKKYKRSEALKSLLNYIDQIHTEVYIPSGVIKTCVHLINFVANHTYDNHPIAIVQKPLAQFCQVSERYITYALKILKQGNILSFYRIVEGRTAKENVYSFVDAFAGLEDDGADIALPTEFLATYKTLLVKKRELCETSYNNINKNISSKFIKKGDKFYRSTDQAQKINESAGCLDRPRYEPDVFEQTFLQVWNNHITSRPLWYVPPVTLKKVMSVFQTKFFGKWDLLDKYLQRVGLGNLNVSKFASYADGNYCCKSWQLNIGYIMKPEVIEKVESGAWDLDRICAERTARKTKKKDVDDDDSLPPEEKEVRKQLISTVGLTFYKTWLEKAKVIFTEAKQIILQLPNKFMLDYAQKPSAEYNRIKGCGFTLTC